LKHEFDELPFSVLEVLLGVIICIFRQIESPAIHCDYFLKAVVVGIVFFHGNPPLNPNTKKMKPSQKKSVCSKNEIMCVILGG
jgi:hypothetical protein